MAGRKHSRSPSQEGEGGEHGSGGDDVLKHPSTKRAKEVDGPDNPYQELLRRVEQVGNDGQKKKSQVRNVLHWFRGKDLRAEDNRAQLKWHGVGAARTDFVLGCLRVLQEQLGDLGIPLMQLTTTAGGEEEENSGSSIIKNCNDTIMEFVKKHDISHVFANFEYEVDELRRDLDLYDRLDQDDKGVPFTILHDQTVVEPATLLTGSGKPHKVFTPYHKAWLAQVAEDPALLDTVGLPAANDDKPADLLKQAATASSEVPESVVTKFTSDEHRDRIRELWPPGHGAAVERLRRFLETKVSGYEVGRSTPAADLRPAFSRCAKPSAPLEMRMAGLSTSRSRAPRTLALRRGFGSLSFGSCYRHMMVVIPHNSMNLPQNLKFDFVQWEDDAEGWRKWCDGKTGMPFVDAGMRQLRAEAYMHNRLRMNTSSYLRTNLLIDYRKGERYFAEHLVDWDLCNNTQGWEPSYTVFNPVIQAEKCDPKGDYIRRWVPELKGVSGKAIFDPFHRLDRAEFDKLGYPAPHVDFKESKERCIQRYKADMADADP